MSRQSPLRLPHSIKLADCFFPPTIARSPQLPVSLAITTQVPMTAPGQLLTQWQNTLKTDATINAMPRPAINGIRLYETCVLLNTNSAMNTSESRRRGAALIIVLAFVALLAAVVVAYMARSAADRPLAQSGFGSAAAGQLARSALTIIVTDFKQEIANAGLPPTETNIVPQRSGNPADIPNLIRRSIRNDTIAFPGVASRASGVNSTTDPSLNGRYVGRSRWNKHYLIPRLNAGNITIDTTPIASFVEPDWVLVTNSGPTVLAAPNTSVLGRYSYCVYDEGGLLDINVAGFPHADSTDPTYISNIGRKGTMPLQTLELSECR